MSDLPRYGLGGTVGGRLGEPQLAFVHGGEHVVTPQQVVPLQPIRVGGSSSGGGGTVIQVGDINVPLHLDGARFGPDLSARDVERIVEEGTDKAVDKLATLLEGVG